MIHDAKSYLENEYDEFEFLGEEKNKEFTRSRPNKSDRQDVKKRQGPSRKVSCGIAARRNKRWSW